MPLYKFKITDLELNDGTAFRPDRMTVILGPNNAGKSRVLKDILALTTQIAPTPVVVRKLQLAEPESPREIDDSCGVKFRLHPGSNSFQYEHLDPDLCKAGSKGIGINGSNWYDALTPAFEHNRQQFWIQVAPALITYLSTEARLDIVKEKPSPHFEYSRQNLLQEYYFADKSVEIAVRTVVQSAFNRQVALDYSVLQKLCLRVGKDFSDLPGDPRDARPILQALPKLDEQGDGIRAFTGIATALLALKRDLILVDEPEAFLHPPQAFRIGAFLADQSNEAKQIFVATHSADVLSGILSRHRENLSILRIDRIDDTNSVRILDPARLDLVIDPLTSSARVLEGLFYQGAVVTEADARFYQYVSRKIFGASNGRETTDIHFVNADNKQTVPRILRIYREMGVRCAGIVDIDVLNDQSEFDKQLETVCPEASERDLATEARGTIARSIGAPSPSRQIQTPRTQMRDAAALLPSEDAVADMTPAEMNGAIKRLHSKLGEAANSTKPWREVKEKGGSALSPDAADHFDRVAAICPRNGLFINPEGELESMLRDHGIPANTEKRAWIALALRLADSLEVDLARQPWKFVQGIHEHLEQKSG